AAPAEPSAPVKSARRVSNPRPKKTAKKAAAESAAEPKAVESAAEAPAVPAPAPVREEAPARHESPAREEREDREEGGHRTPWAEPETIQGETGTQGGKRKRRRKKKGGANAGAHHGEAQAPRPQAPAAEGAPAQPQAPRPVQPQPQPQHAPRVPLDLEEVSKKAWRIFLSEVSEEGLALIGDNDARDLTRRSFRLAEIFLEEKARRSR
ncbi:MAG TPA: hypothetical protein VIM57_06335, partial [Luteolibacter sp.]